MHAKRAVGALLISFLLVACAAVSGLDSIEVCPGASCSDGSAPPPDGLDQGDTATGTDGTSNADVAVGQDATDGTTGKDGALTDRAVADTAIDAPKDVGHDSPTGVSLPCGNNGLVCVQAQVCCLGGPGDPQCQTSCNGSSITITCERTLDCPTGDICCGVNWGTGVPQQGTICTTVQNCPDPASAVVCNPNDPTPCPGGDLCNGMSTHGGQTFHTCT